MSWRTAQLGDICSPKQHKTIPASTLLDEGFPVYGANGQIGFYSEYTHEDETVAITCRGATCGTINVAPAKSYITGNAMALDNLDQGRVDLRFLVYALRNRGLHDVISGSAQPQITRGPLLAAEIPLPPLEEQERIAAILDQADELRRKRQCALDRLNQLGQAIFIEMFGDPASNPKGFDAKSLGEIIEFIGGSQPAKSHFLYEPGPDRVRFIQIRDFRTDKYPTYVPKALAKRPFSEDDVMIGRYGPPVFQIFRGLSGTYNVALMKAKPRRNLTSDFVFYLLQEPKLHGYVVANSERTAGQSGVNLELLEKYPAYEPPTPLLSAFSERVGTLNAQLFAARRAAEQSDALFISLQHRAFRGEI